MDLSKDLLLDKANAHRQMYDCTRQLVRGGVGEQENPGVESGSQ